MMEPLPNCFLDLAHGHLDGLAAFLVRFGRRLVVRCVQLFLVMPWDSSALRRKMGRFAPDRTRF
jgi:hypothetical protein